MRREVIYSTYVALAQLLRVYVALLRCMPRMVHRVCLPPEMEANECLSATALPECSAFHTIFCRGERIYRRQFVLDMLRSLPEEASLHKCAVCLSSLCGGGESRKLRCGHSFHHHCIVRWLLQSICMTCPLCRDTLLKRSVDSSKHGCIVAAEVI